MPQLIAINHDSFWGAIIEHEVRIYALFLILNYMAENSSLVKRALTADGEFTKEQVNDILFYLKEILGVILGVVIGVVGITGLPGIIVFVLSISLLCYLYVYKFLGVD